MGIMQKANIKVVWELQQASVKTSFWQEFRKDSTILHSPRNFPLSWQHGKHHAMKAMQLGNIKNARSDSVQIIGH